MLRSVASSSLVLIFASSAFAQIAERPKPRPFTQSELQYWASICSTLEQAVPKSFKNYDVKKDNCNSFDWTERDKQGRSLTVESTKGEPIGNVPNFTINFVRTEEDMQPQVDSILIAIRDSGGDAKKITAAGNRESRLNATRELHVLLIVNYHAKRDIEAQYSITTKPLPLTVPGASFAKLYTIPLDKYALTKSGVAKPNAEAPQKIVDNAIIIFGAPPKVTTDPSDDNITFAIDRVYTQDAVTNITTQPTKNVVVMMSGDGADIRALVASIDWKAIGKLVVPGGK